jgi:hypothetical protein
VQNFILILTILWMNGPNSVRMATTNLQEFTTLSSCVTAADRVRNMIVEQAKAAEVYYLPRVKAVCLPK